MLEIKKISKIYETAGFKQKALDNVSVNFRKNEFVAILGPSGSGKTTCLNVIGGLDKYDSGDLIINGKSTKEFTDTDWDAYRKEYAYSNMHDGDWRDAQSIFLNMLDENPDDLHALNALGIMSYAMQNYSDAESYFTDAIEAHPNSSLGYLNRSVIYELRQDYQAALRDVTQAVNNSSAPDDFYKRALLYTKLKEWEK